MALWSDPLTFQDLYGTDGLGWLVGIRDNTTDLPARQNATNWAYKELAGYLKGYWRRRSFDYTASSTPALTAGTRAYNTPTTSGAVFDSVDRLYYRSSGVYRDVPVVGDEEWLQKSATASTNAGYPQFARVVQTASAVQLELNRPLNQAFIDAITTLTVEYNIAIAPLAATTDTTILPRNYVPLIIPLAAWWYALSQGDHRLATQLKPEAERARVTVLRHDLTRTGRPRQIRPRYTYTGRGRHTVSRDYGES